MQFGEPCGGARNVLQGGGTSAGRRPVGAAATVIGLLIVLYLADTNPIVNAAEVARNNVAKPVPHRLRRDGGRTLAKKVDRSGDKGRARVHLVVDFQAELKQRDAEAGWTMAQELTALHGENRAADDGALALMNATHLPGTSCWPEYVADASCHAGATSWALYSLGGLGLPADPRLHWKACWRLQSQDGWWPMYFKVGGDNAYASTYGSMGADGDQRPVPLRLAPYCNREASRGRGQGDQLNHLQPGSAS